MLEHFEYECQLPGLQSEANDLHSGRTQCLVDSPLFYCMLPTHHCGLCCQELHELEWWAEELLHYGLELFTQVMAVGMCQPPIPPMWLLILGGSELGHKENGT